jgi:RNA polymerase sigma factor (sigma-70 family)
MEREATGDKDAVAFLKRFRGAFDYAFQLEGIPFADRSDLFQDLSIRVLQRFRKGGVPTEHSLSYAVTIALHVAINYRRVKRLPEGTVDADRLVGYELPTDLQVIRLEGHERLHACIAALSPVRRAVVKARLQGMLHREIGVNYNMSAQASKNLYLRAVEQLRTMLISQDYI